MVRKKITVKHHVLKMKLFLFSFFIFGVIMHRKFSKNYVYFLFKSFMMTCMLNIVILIAVSLDCEQKKRN